MNDTRAAEFHPEKYFQEADAILQRLTWDERFQPPLSNEALRAFAVDAAHLVLGLFETVFPHDWRPRSAIVCSRDFLRQQASQADLERSFSEVSRVSLEILHFLDAPQNASTQHFELRRFWGRAAMHAAAAAAATVHPDPLSAARRGYRESLEAQVGWAQGSITAGESRLFPSAPSISPGDAAGALAHRWLTERFATLMIEAVGH